MVQYILDSTEDEIKNIKAKYPNKFLKVIGTKFDSFTSEITSGKLIEISDCYDEITKDFYAYDDVSGEVVYIL